MVRVKQDRDRHNRLGQNGLTLIEVLIAFAILAMIVISVYSFIGQNTRFLLVAEDRLLASIAIDNQAINDLVSIRGRTEGTETLEETIGGRTYVIEREALEVNEGLLRVTYTARRQLAPQVPGQSQAPASSQSLSQTLGQAVILRERS
ncbi:MAG: type II secretion system minor pseudopilin GspI [Pseudomonadota bacterium]